MYSKWLYVSVKMHLLQYVERFYQSCMQLKLKIINQNIFRFKFFHSRCCVFLKCKKFSMIQVK